MNSDSSLNEVGIEDSFEQGSRSIDSLVDPARTLDEFEDMPPPERPPAIAKDRVMARVREDSVSFYVPPPED